MLCKSRPAPTLKNSLSENSEPPPLLRSNITKSKSPPPTQQLYELHEFSGLIKTIVDILWKIKELQVRCFLDIPTKLNSVLEHVNSKKDPFSEMFAFSKPLTNSINNPLCNFS